MKDNIKPEDLHAVNTKSFGDTQAKGKASMKNKKTRTITIELKHPTKNGGMAGSWATAHTDKAPTKEEIKSECESWLSDLGFDVHKIIVK